MGVKFNEDKNPFQYSQNVKGITGFLINKGVVKNKSQASILMLIVSVICLATSFLIINSESEQVSNLNSEERITDLAEEGIYEY